MRDRHKATNNTIHFFTKRDTNTTSTINLSLEGYPQSPLTRGISQIKEGLQLGGLTTTNNFFSHKTMILIDRIEDKLKCEKTKGMENKYSKKILGKN